MILDNDERNSDDETSETTHTINENNELQPRRRFKMKIEVPLFLSSIGLALEGTTINNIMLYRMCVHSLHHSKDECKAFLLPDRTNDTRELEEEVQRYATYFTMVSVIQALIPAVLSLFVGAWSDVHGRKPLIVCPLFGLTVSSMITVLYSMFDDIGPWWFLLAILPFSCTGGYTVLLTGVYCYINDTTTTEKRSIRLLIIDAANAAGTILGAILTSHLLRLVGNVYLLLIVTALYLAAYSFTDVFLDESMAGAVPAQGGLISILDRRLLKTMVTECLKQRPNHGRTKIFLLTIANTFTLFISYGTSTLDYMYTREKLNWALSDYTTFSSMNTAVAFVGSIVGMAVFQRVLGIRDMSLAIVSFMFSIGDSLIKTFAVSSWQMYLTLICFFRILSGPLIRSFLTKMLPLEDVAKVLALLCTMESICCPIVAPLLYNTLYSFTIHDFPGAIYVLGASINATCAVMLGAALWNGFCSLSTITDLGIMWISVISEISMYLPHLPVNSERVRWENSGLFLNILSITLLIIKAKVCMFVFTSKRL